MVHGNGLFAFHKRVDVNRCAKCGELLSKWDEPLPGFRVTTLKGLDFSTTYDSLEIASVLFKECYESHGMVGLSFTPLEGNRPCFKVLCHNTVPFDAGKRGTRFLNRCDTCAGIKR